MPVELFEREDEPGEIVRKAFAERMCQSIDLEDAETTAKVLEGAEALVRDERLEETGRRLDEMLREYERQQAAGAGGGGRDRERAPARSGHLRVRDPHESPSE